jgi:benzodiazapine receptor
MSSQITALVISLFISFIVASLGGLASVSAGDFYAELARPSWAPPAWLFGPVWTLLYIIMAVASWLVWGSDVFNEAKVALSFYLLQLVFNTLWSWLFFYLHMGLWAFVDIIFLWVCLVIVIFLFLKISVVAGVLMFPYLLWVSFAAMLNYSIWKLNPGIL